MAEFSGKTLSFSTFLSGGGMRFRAEPKPDEPDEPGKFSRWVASGLTISGSARSTNFEASNLASLLLFWLGILSRSVTDTADDELTLLVFPDFLCLLFELELQEVVEDAVESFLSRFRPEPEPDLGVLFL